jgi:hypothetical protein
MGLAAMVVVSEVLVNEGLLTNSNIWCVGQEGPPQEDTDAVHQR